MSGRRRSGGGGGHGGGGEERWLLTYADMITLLLALFIVLFAMSTLNAKKFDYLRRSLNQTFKGAVLEEPGDVLDGSNGFLDPNAANSDPDSAVTVIEDASNAKARTATQFAKEQQRFEKIVQRAGLKQDVAIEPSERGFVISIAGDALFDPGSADLKPEAEQRLVVVARELVTFDRQLAVLGHTDGVPYSGPFRDNLGLSQARAWTVYHFLEGRGMDPRDMHTEGWGDLKPKVRPRNPRDPMRANRRIEIVVLAPGADDGGLPKTRAERDALLAKPAAKPAVKQPDLRADVQADIDSRFVAPLVDASNG